MDGMLSNMEKVLEAKNIFKRERKSTKTRALGVILYHFGISLQNTSLVFSSFEQTIHEAARDWYLRVAKIFQVRKALQRVIAIDETKIKINRRWRILWAAVDIENWDVLGIWVTQGRSSFEAYGFIRHVLRRCEKKPKILVDSGPWYLPALNRVGVEWEHITFGLRIQWNNDSGFSNIVYICFIIDNHTMLLSKMHNPALKFLSLSIMSSNDSVDIHGSGINSIKYTHIL